MAAELRIYANDDTLSIGANNSQLKVRGANTNGIGFYGSTGTLGSEYMRICNATSGTTTAGNVGIGLTNPSEKLQIDGKIKCEDIKYPITDAGGTESDQSLVSLHSTVSSLSTSLSSHALNSALSDYVLSSQFPQADDVTLGGVRIDGNNLSINPTTGILSAVSLKNNRLYMSASSRYKPPPT